MEASVRRAVFLKVIGALRNIARFDVTAISESTNIRHDLALGRLGRAEFGLNLEEAFDRELPDDVVEGFVSIADVVSYFSRRYFEDAGDRQLPSPRIFHQGAIYRRAA